MRRGLWLIAIAAVVACVQLPAPNPAKLPGLQSPDAKSKGAISRPSWNHMAPAVGTAAGAGFVVVSVEWPGRHALAIPPATKRFELSATPVSKTQPVATASLVFPATSTRLGPIPEGTVSIAAEAWDEGGAKLATGSTLVGVLANQAVAAKLILVPVNPIKVTSLSAQSGVAGDAITVGVEGVQSNLKVRVGTVGLATLSVFVDAKGSGSVVVQIGKTVTAGGLVVESLGFTATSSLPFSRIASVNISPLVGSVLSNQSLNFAGTALGADLTTVISPHNLTFTVQNAVDESTVPTGSRRKVGSINPLGVFLSAATGDDLVLFGRPGTLTATAAVKVTAP